MDNFLEKVAKILWENIVKMSYVFCELKDI